MNDDINHMKDMHEVQDNQPGPFNCVCCRGVAAKARSVHLMYPMDRRSGARPEGKGHLDTPTTDCALLQLDCAPGSSTSDPDLEGRGKGQSQP